MKKLFRILRYAKPYWLYAVLNILFNILSTLFSLVSFTLFIPVLNMLFQKVKVHPVAPSMDLSQAHSFSELMKIGIDRGRATRKNLKVGICGEHGGDPDSVKFCHRIGMNYVSCSPFRVPIARLAAAQAAVEDKNKKK